MAYNILMLFFIMLSFFDVFIIKQKKNKFLILILAFWGYLFFFGLRGFMAWDWSHYYPNWLNSINFFEAVKNNFIFNLDIELEYEKGYQIWMSILKIFFINWHSYLFFTTLVDIICLLIIFYRYSPYPVFSILLFLGFGGMQLQLDLMRNFKAMLLFLFSIEYLISKKNMKYFLINVISSSLHRSCLVYLMIGYFLKKNFYKYKKIILSFFIIGIIFFMFSDDILYETLKIIRDIFISFRCNIFNKIINKLNIYLNSDYASPRGIGLGFLERIFSFSLFYRYRKEINKTRYEKIFFNIFLFYIFSYLYGSGVRIIFDRLGLLFICSYWVLYPILLKKISNIKKIVIFIFLISFCSLKINSFYVLNLKEKELCEYKNILWNKESYEEKYKIFKNVMKRYDMKSKR